jgi:hypothetical protein
MPPVDVVALAERLDTETTLAAALVEKGEAELEKRKREMLGAYIQNIINGLLRP